MTWIDRLQPTIILTSPTGAQFSAYWRGDYREMEKKLGIFEFPKSVGAVVQDLDVRAVRFPLSFWFEGPDHDITAIRFFAACAERGVWQIDHPVKGLSSAQLVNVREEVQPTDSGNITAFTSDWIEIQQFSSVLSIIQRTANVKERTANLQTTALSQFTAKVKIDKPTLLTQLLNAVSSVQNIVSTTLAPLNKAVSDINAAIESVHRGIAATVESSALSLISLGGQLQSLITLPAMAIESIGTRLDYYGQLIANLTDLNPSDPTIGGVNALATHELIATSCLAAVAGVVTDGDPTTREQAIEFLETVNLQFSTITANLDAGQSLYSGNAIDQQFFSQSESYNDAVLLVAEINALMMRRLFDLAVAKKIILERNRCPVEIALTEGVDLDLFIGSNNLRGNDILLLPSGREVTVYL